MTCGFLIQLVFCKKQKTMWFIGVEVEQETSAPPPKKNPGSAPDMTHVASPVINSVPLVVSVEMNTVNYKPRLTQRVLRFAVFRRRKFSNL